MSFLQFPDMMHVDGVGGEQIFRSFFSPPFRLLLFLRTRQLFTPLPQLWGDVMAHVIFPPLDGMNRRIFNKIMERQEERVAAFCVLHRRRGAKKNWKIIVEAGICFPLRAVRWLPEQCWCSRHNN